MKSLCGYGGWALVTGASAGIGVEFVRQIAREGVDCVLVARREDRLKELANEVEDQYGVSTRCLAVDLANDTAADEIAAACDDVEIGILVNNAGFGDAGTFHTRDPEKLKGMVNVNCLAPTLLTRAFLPALLDRGAGAVIVVSSVFGIIPAPFETTYGATKQFDLAFGEGLWAELRGTGVDCITVCPSITATGFLLAEGMDPKSVERAYKNATPASHIAKITLRKLGAACTVGPRDFHLAGVAKRFMTRGTVARTVSYFMKQQFDVGGHRSKE